jgi:hypothetical protein
MDIRQIVEETLARQSEPLNNDDRADQALALARCFRAMSGIDPAPDQDGPKTSAADMMSQFMHWAQRDGWDFDAALATARMNFEAEICHLCQGTAQEDGICAECSEKQQTSPKIDIPTVKMIIEASRLVSIDELDHDDKSDGKDLVQGIYVVEVGQGTYESQVETALDVFHRSVPVSCLEHYDFNVRSMTSQDEARDDIIEVEPFDLAEAMKGALQRGSQEI